MHGFYHAQSGLIAKFGIIYDKKILKCKGETFEKRQYILHSLQQTIHQHDWGYHHRLVSVFMILVVMKLKSIFITYISYYGIMYWLYLVSMVSFYLLYFWLHLLIYTPHWNICSMFLIHLPSVSVLPSVLPSPDTE